MFETQWILGKQNAEDALFVRNRVYIDELKENAGAVFDDKDDYAAHLVVRQDGKAIASARLIIEDTILVMDKACVIKDHTGQGFFDLCLRLCLDRASRMDKTLQITTDEGHMAYFASFGFIKTDGGADGGIVMRVKPKDIIWNTKCKD